MPDPLILAMPKLPPEAVALLRTRFDVALLDIADVADLPAGVRGVRGIATPGRDPGLGRRLDDHIFAQLPALEIVASFSSGLDGIDTNAASARGLLVTNAPDALVDPVADIALGLVISALRCLSRGDRQVRAGGWSGCLPATSLRGKRVGIVGLGRIGSAVAARLEVCGMSIACTGRTPRTTPYDYVPDLVTLARTSDVLVLCCPLTDETRGMVDGTVLGALGPSGYLVNVARGEVVDEDALIAALSSGTIAGAGLDVFHGEPRIDPRFMTLETVVLSPHLGAGTPETRDDMFHAMFDSLCRHFGPHPAD